MTAQPIPTLQIPTEILRYLNEPVAESKQFDFLIGDWHVDGLRYKEDGTPLLSYKALWSAVYLHGGRMVMDDFQALGPTGRPVSSFVTLRTYSEATRRWEFVGLRALSAAIPSEWYGEARNGEMILTAITRTPAGDTTETRTRFFDITADSFSWDGVTSTDQGKHWRKTTELKVIRASAKIPA
jgi:hypothetical protein